MAPTKSTPPAQQKPAEQKTEEKPAETGTTNGAPPSSDPAGEAAQRRAEEARLQQTPDKDREDGEEPKAQERSKKGVEAGDFLWYRGDYGPVFALVTAGGEGSADVLLLRGDEVPRARTVAVYDTEEDASRGYADAGPHVAWHH